MHLVNIQTIKNCTCKVTQTDGVSMNDFFSITEKLNVYEKAKKADYFEKCCKK